MTFIEYHTDPVTLHSGLRSHWLVRADLMFMNDDIRAAVIKLFRSKISSGGVDVVAIARGGVPWAEALAEGDSNIVVFVLNKERERDGVLYSPRSSRQLVLVDDVATTGSSLDLIPRADLRLVVFDRMRRDSTRHPDVAYGVMELPILPRNKDGD